MTTTMSSLDISHAAQFEPIPPGSLLNTPMTDAEFETYLLANNSDIALRDVDFFLPEFSE